MPNAIELLVGNLYKKWMYSSSSKAEFTCYYIEIRSTNGQAILSGLHYGSVSAGDADEREYSL